MGFSRILFIAYILFLVTLASHLQPDPLVSGFKGHLLSAAVYFSSLILIRLFLKLFKKKIVAGLFISEILWVASFFVNFFILNTRELFFENLPYYFASNAFAIVSLIIYFAGIFLIQYWSFPNKSFFDLEAAKEAARQVQLCLPLPLPFIVFNLVPGIHDGGFFELIFAFLFFLPVLFIFFPWVMQRAWDAKPISDEGLAFYLNNICQKAGFKHGDLKVWTALERSANAAIIGVIPKFRYVLFTKKILNNLSKEALGAVLAHEIGHSKRGHLYFIPLIFGGMFLTGSLFSAFLLPEFYYQISKFLFPFAQEKTLLFADLGVIFFYILLFALYFRLIFGFYSRLFEREADLYGSTFLEIPSSSLIEALDSIGTLNGNIHKKPSWHHYSISERIDFLEKSARDPKLAQKQIFKVKKWIFIYLVLFGTAIIALAI